MKTKKQQQITATIRYKTAKITYTNWGVLIEMNFPIKRMLAEMLTGEELLENRVSKGKINYFMHRSKSILFSELQSVHDVYKEMDLDIRLSISLLKEKYKEQLKEQLYETF